MTGLHKSLAIGGIWIGLGLMGFVSPFLVVFALIPAVGLCVAILEG